MAGARANLAVTKDGESYNKLQRPDSLFDKPAALKQANERKRERAVVDRPIADTGSGNKRAKTRHVDLAANKSQSLHNKHRAEAVSECGMRMTLPIDEEEQHSDDSTAEALAYLRSVQSEASTIPHLLVASRTHNEDTDSTFRQASRPLTSQRTFYQDGAWISVDEGYETPYNDDYCDDPGAQESYHKQLVKRFETLRSTLGDYVVHRPTQNPNAGAYQSVSVKPPSNRHEWLYTLDREYPTRAQISQLDEKNVRRGLEYCVHAMDRFQTISVQKSCWIWTLLALSNHVGTLDSRNMSHIRDLGNKAGQLSASLHQGARREDGGVEDVLSKADPAADGPDDDTEVEKTAFPDTSDTHSSGMAHVRLGANKHLVSTIETGTHNGVQAPTIGSLMSDISTDIDGSNTTDTNNDTLERARARLLAQLGDNLVQAGIPDSARNTDEARPHLSEKLHRDSDDPQHEVKIRAIPSRAEAERQRQMMRVQDSVTASSERAHSLSSEPSDTTQPVTKEDRSCLVDLNTRVTIDMILTVVAECYGQRDLLKFRRPW